MASKIFFILLNLVSLTQGNKVAELEEAITKKDYEIAAPLALQFSISLIDKERVLGNWAIGVMNLSNDPDLAKIHLDLALRESNDPILKMKIKNAFGNYHDIVGGTKESVAQFLQVVTLAKQHDSTFLAGVYNNLSISYRSLGKPDSAVFYGLEGLKFAENFGQVYEQKRLLNSLAICFAVQGDLNQANFYFRKSLDKAIENMDSIGISKGYVNLTQVKIYTGQLDSAIYFLNLSKLFNLGKETTLDIIDQYTLLADVMIEEKNPEKALGYYLSALDEIGEMSFPSEKISILLGMAKAIIASGDLVKAQEFLIEVFNLIETLNQQSFLLSANTLQREIYIRAKDFEKGVLIQGTIDSLSIVKFDLDRASKIEDLREKYESEKREQQIQNLEQEAVISSFKIQQQNFQLIGILLLLFIIGVVGFFVYRNRNLKNIQQRLIVEQKLLRSQMNPHFLFNALSSVHGYIYEGDKKQASEYLSMFSELTRDILNHSSSELILLVDELDTLQKYVTLQQLRFPHISYQVNKEDNLDTENLLVPPMILQPFVENAIEHGLKNKSEEGMIKVSLSKNADLLQIQIEDNGVGLETSNVKSAEVHALSITEERIRLLAGMRNRKNLISLVGKKNNEQGVLVTLNLPILEEV